MEASMGIAPQSPWRDEVGPRIRIVLDHQWLRWPDRGDLAPGRLEQRVNPGAGHAGDAMKGEPERLHVALERHDARRIVHRVDLVGPPRSAA